MGVDRQQSNTCFSAAGHGQNSTLPSSINTQLIKNNRGLDHQEEKDKNSYKISITLICKLGFQNSNSTATAT